MKCFLTQIILNCPLSKQLSLKVPRFTDLYLIPRQSQGLEAGFTQPVALHSFDLLGVLRQSKNILKFGEKTDEDRRDGDTAELVDVDNGLQDDENKKMKQERKRNGEATIKKTYMIRMGKRNGSFKRPAIKKVFLTRLGKRSDNFCLLQYRYIDKRRKT